MSLELKKHLLRYIQIAVGCLIVCLGFNLFIIPAHLLTGGISGIALIIYYLTGLPVGAQNFVFLFANYLFSLSSIWQALCLGYHCWNRSAVFFP